jgi:hypothetical protein
MEDKNLEKMVLLGTKAMLMSLKNLFPTRDLVFIK